MDSILRDFTRAWESRNGQALAETVSPSKDVGRLREFSQTGTNETIEREMRARIVYWLANRCSNDEVNGWIAVYHAFWKAAQAIVDAEEGRVQVLKDCCSYQCCLAGKVYRSWSDVVSQVSRGFSHAGFEKWSLPMLEDTAKMLRVFAMAADDERNKIEQAKTNLIGDDMESEDDKHQYLEACARQLTTLFNVVLNDRAELERSRKWSIYYIINLLFKTYFRLEKATLSRNLIRALTAYRSSLPDMIQFKLSQVVTFQYYSGVLEFLEENYAAAEPHLTEAFFMCHKDSWRNKERILTYLVPCHLLTANDLPSSLLLSDYPKLNQLFAPLAKAIKCGNLKGFDDALKANEDQLVKRRIYLTLERGRDIALRNLFRKVFLLGGFENPKNQGDKHLRRTRIPVAEFQAAVSFSTGGQVDNDEVECLLANMIYKNLMKGYISRERSMVVLSKAEAFPGTGV